MEIKKKYFPDETHIDCKNTIVFTCTFIQTIRELSTFEFTKFFKWHFLLAQYQQWKNNYCRTGGYLKKPRCLVSRKKRKVVINSGGSLTLNSTCVAYFLVFKIKFKRQRYGLLSSIFWNSISNFKHSVS